MSFVDLHCHLLPGLDDGAATMAHTIAHARRLEAAGVTDVACTPHIKSDEFPGVQIGRLAGLRERAQHAIDDAGIAVRLHPGGELSHYEVPLLAPAQLELIAQGPDGARWLLLECPFDGLGESVVRAAERLSEHGFGVLLAHPERAAAITGADRRLRALVDAGALLQVNATSLLGRHGRTAHTGAVRLLREGLVWCLASDGHPGTRDDTLDRGADALVRLGLGVRAAELTQDNPRALLHHGAAALPLAA
jgi:protein-tyrosine phosphatase